MPVLRARGPRVEGGLCYPRVCWAAVNRATHWGVASHKNPPSLVDAHQQVHHHHLCARASTTTSWPGHTMARRNNPERGALATHQCKGGVACAHSLDRRHQRQPQSGRAAQPPQAHRQQPHSGGRRGLSVLLSKISAQDKTKVDRDGYLVSAGSDHDSSGRCLESNSISDDLGISDSNSNSDILSACETISANETLSICSDSCSGSDEDGNCSYRYAELTGDVHYDRLTSISVTSGAKCIKSVGVVPTTDAGGRCQGSYTSGGNAAARTMTPSEMNGRSSSGKEGLGVDQNHSNGFHPSVARDENGCDLPVKSSVYRQKSTSKGCGGMHKGGGDRNSRAPLVLRQATFTIAKGDVTITSAGAQSADTEQAGRCGTEHAPPDRHNTSPCAAAGYSSRQPAPLLPPGDNVPPARVSLVPPAALSRATTPHPPITMSSSPRNRQPFTLAYPLCRRRAYSGVRVKGFEGGTGVEEDEGGGDGQGRECSNVGRLLDLSVSKGQRGSGSSKRGAPFARGSSTSEDHDHSLQSEQQKEEHLPQPQSQQHRGRAMKISVREEATKKTAALSTPTTRTRSGSRSSGGASPAALHGRAPYKTATVAPAPTKLSTKTNSLNRFGFRNSAQVKSGDSTDSVNSILSDAQTVSDSNSNIFDLCDEYTENNKSTKKNSDSASCNSTHTDIPKRLELSSIKLNKIPALTETPKVGSGSQPGRITAFTRQLPKPQVVTVKSVSPKSQTPRLHSPKPSSPSCYSPMPNTPKSQSPLVKDRVKSPSVKSHTQTPKIQMDQASRGKQHSPGTSQHIPRVSRDSESSTKSVTEADSGLGSSSESDKIRGEGETDTLKSNNIESTEDLSDAWLKGKQKNQETIKRQLGSVEVCLDGTGSFELKRRSIEMKGLSTTDIGTPSPAKSETVIEKKAKTSKEKREGTITYGMARQKFAPYSRNRFGYGYQSGAGRSGDSASSDNSSTPTCNVTKLPGSSGLVRSRVAMLETTPSKKPQQTPVLRRTNLKKPIIRPTSLEKTPLLVMPVTEKTIELSKPVCRRLEYSECKMFKSDTQKELNYDIQPGNNPKLSTSKTVTGDILIVGSVERETQKDTNIIVETENYGSYYESSYDKVSYIGKDDTPLKVSPDSNLKISVSKASQDINENEKLMIEETSGEVSLSPDSVATPNDITDTSFSEKTEDVIESEGISNKHILQSPDDMGMKAITPQSESSFEILESLSETIDLTAEDMREDAEFSLTEAETSHESKVTVLETKRESDMDSAASLSGSSVSLSTEGTSKSAVLQKPKLVPATPGSQNFSQDSVLPLSDLPTSAQTIKSEDIPKSSFASPVDKKAPLGQTISALKSSLESKSSMESSIESQKSMGMVNAMVESGDRSTLSGMCTPTLTSGRGDLDQDFLIDDEIADQPGLMFGESTMASSFFTDDGIFDDLASSPSHTALKPAVMDIGRSRADSVDTTSSLGADDLMLDYDAEEGKAGGSSNSSSLSVSLPGTLTGARPKKMHLRITIPGRRYDEEVLSPDASEIFSEWTAMMAEMGSTVSERCVSRDGTTCGGRHHVLGLAVHQKLIRQTPDDQQC
ncbi:uncharacterized protein [Panulirus ornatus]|uniref:uncharacterized protein isoform X2 n=1 Tax=Panulirus ornatus TaxID=150431 RepID=UPI003A85026D